MGNYSTRNKELLTGWQMNVAHMMFRGVADKDIVIEQFKVDPEDEKGIRNGKDKLRRLRRSQKFQDYYQSLITEWRVRNIGKALTRLEEQLDEKNGWLRNKACNDILNQSKQFTGNDENTVVVKVESGIALGTPDGE